MDVHANFSRHDIFPFEALDEVGRFIATRFHKFLQIELTSLENGRSGLFEAIVVDGLVFLFFLFLPEDIPDARVEVVVAVFEGGEGLCIFEGS